MAGRGGPIKALNSAGGGVERLLFWVSFTAKCRIDSRQTAGCRNHATPQGDCPEGSLMKEDRVMLYAMMLLNQLKRYVFQLKKDEDGAALIEYTVLLGILLVAVIAIITFVGGWISGQWGALSGQL